MKKILMLLLANALIQNIQADDIVIPPTHYTNKNTVDINYPISKEAGVINRVELWVTEDGGDTWLLSKVDQDLRPPVSYTPAKDGLYGFFVLQMSDVRDKPEPPSKGTKPQWLYVFDKKKPEINLEYQKSLIYKTEGEVPLKWSLSDSHLSELPISISLSTDHGKTWNALQSELKDIPTSIKAPSQDKAEFQIKITAKDLAGNESSVISENLYIDGSLPIAKVIGPIASIKSQFEVIIQTFDEGKAGVKGINLWFSLDNGAEWKLFARDLNPQAPILFTPPTGDKIGLYATATDTVGNESFQPVSGTKPQLVVLTDSIKPVITIIEPKNFKSVGGDKKLNIKWEIKDDNIQLFPTEIYFSKDGGNQWYLITKNEKPTGTFSWTTPKIDSDKCCLKLIALDEVGNMGETILPFFFEIDSSAPLAKAMYLQNKDIPEMKSNSVPEVGIEAKTLDFITTEFNDIDSLKEDKQYDLVMERLQRLEEKFPDNSRIYYEKALILSTYLAADDSLSMNRAINFLEKAISLKPDYEAAYILRGSIYYKKYSVEKDELQKKHYLLLAEHEYLNAIKILGDSYEEYSNLGIVYFRLNRPEDAKKYLLKATLLKKRPGICYWYLARIEENQENFEKSEIYWRKAAAAYGVNTVYGEKAVLNVESAKSKKIGKQILE
jgi:hypothetical protein